MKLNEINSEQFINIKIQNVFDFFSKPENLQEITPKRLGFNIITPGPIEMEKGTVIDYYIKISYIPIRWRTIITNYNPPYKFVDQQIKGPYSFWHHTHTFSKLNGGTLIKDNIKYLVPFGIIGKIINKIWIKRDLENIFDYRKNKIKILLERN